VIEKEKLRGSLLEFIETCSMDEMIWVMLAFAKRFPRFARFMEGRSGKASTASLTIHRGESGPGHGRRETIDNVMQRFLQELDARDMEAGGGDGNGEPESRAVNQ